MSGIKSQDHWQWPRLNQDWLKVSTRKKMPNSKLGAREEQTEEGADVYHWSSVGGWLGFFSKCISQNVFLKTYFSKCISQNIFLKNYFTVAYLAQTRTSNPIPRSLLSSSPQNIPNLPQQKNLGIQICDGGVAFAFSYVWYLYLYLWKTFDH